MKLLIIATALLMNAEILGANYQELFDKKVSLKENYVLIDDAGLKKIVIPFHFNKTTTNIDSKLVSAIDPRKIRSIEYVYFENSNSVYQHKLNQGRIDTLASLFGHKIKNVDASVFSTIVLSSQHVSRTQFTGFVITTELSHKEIKSLIDVFLVPSSSDKSTSAFTLDTLSDYGYVLPHLHQNINSEEYKVVAATFERNKSWKNKLIVVDVTGSMTPYFCQYLLWLKLNFNPKENQNYVFFNDGNDYKGYNKKVVGATGGLYFTQNSFGYASIENAIRVAMNNGCGGDIPENNIEALLAGEARYKLTDDVILIADNNASPRDLSLINKLKKPVHVILCGVQNGRVNTDYLNLAYKTKGTVHTIEEDLENLINKKEGDHFTFLDSEFIIKSGEIVLKKSTCKD